MNHKAFIESGLLEAYVLGALPEHEAAGVACMAAQHPEIRAALEKLEEGLESLAMQETVQPPQHLKEEIWASLQDITRQEGAAEEKPAVHKTRVFEAPRPEVKKSTFSWALAASLIALVGSLIANFWLHENSNTLKSEQRVAQAQIDSLKLVGARQQEELLAYEEQSRMIGSPNMKMVLMRSAKPGGDMSGMVFWNAAERKAFVSLGAMPAPPSGKQYQLWAIAGGQPKSLGVLPIDMAGKPQPMAVPEQVAQSEAFAISLEPMGGVASPTPDMIQVLGTVSKG